MRMRTAQAWMSRTPEGPQLGLHQSSAFLCLSEGHRGSIGNCLLSAERARKFINTLPFILKILQMTGCLLKSQNDGFSRRASGFVWSCSHRSCSLPLPCAFWPSLVWIPLLAHPIILPHSTSAQLMRPPWKLIQKIDRPSGDSHLVCISKRLNEFYIQVDRLVTGAEVATGGLRCTGGGDVGWYSSLAALSVTHRPVSHGWSWLLQTDRQTG